FTIGAVACSPDGGLLAANAHKGSVRLWDLRPSGSVGSLGPYDRVAGLAYSPDGQKLAVLAASGYLTICNSPHRRPSPQEFTASLERDLVPRPQGIAFRPDGKAFATARGEGVVVRDVRFGENVPLFQHKGAARAVAYSGDGKSLAWVDRDGLVWASE